MPPGLGRPDLQQSLSSLWKLALQDINETVDAEYGERRSDLMREMNSFYSSNSCSEDEGEDLGVDEQIFIHKKRRRVHLRKNPKRYEESCWGKMLNTSDWENELSRDGEKFLLRFRVTPDMFSSAATRYRRIQRWWRTQEELSMFVKASRELTV